MIDTAEVGRSFRPRPWELLGRELARDGVGLREGWGRRKKDEGKDEVSSKLGTWGGGEGERKCMKML